MKKPQDNAVKESAVRSRRSTAKADLSINDTETRLAKLESTVAELLAEKAAASAAKSIALEGAESNSRATNTVVSPRKFWAIDGVLRGAEARQNASGGIVFAGQVVLPMGETYAWQIENDTDALLAADWSAANAPLAALAHPMRLTILRALLSGSRDTQSLQALPGMGTTGQLYHHLKELEAAGWIRQPRRGEYQVLAERVVPLFTILATCEITKK